MPASVALDASKFTSGSPEERAAYARDLLVQLGSNGYVRLKNHDISSELVDSCFGWVRLRASLSVAMLISRL